jgi:hypothetical protein
MSMLVCFALKEDAAPFHKIAVLLFVVFGWRVKLRLQGKWAATPYLVLRMNFVAALAYQGHLGGAQAFSGM